MNTPRRVPSVGRRQMTSLLSVATMDDMRYYKWKFLLVVLAGWINRHQQDVIEYLLEENRVHKELHSGKRLRFTDEQRRRLAAKAKAIGRGTLKTLDCIVTPDTLLRWYRKLIARKYDGSAKHGGSSPERRAKIVETLIRMAKENPSCGYTRLRDMLMNLGFKMSRSTVRRVLLDHGLEPAPRRSTWKTFMKSHWDQLAATDTFTVEVLTPLGLVRYTVLFVMHLSTRKIDIAGIAHDPGEAWVKNVFRGQVDAIDGFLLGKRYIIHDRDPIFSPAVQAFLAGAGVEPGSNPDSSFHRHVHTPAASLKASQNVPIGSTRFTGSPPQKPYIFGPSTMPKGSAEMKRPMTGE